MHSTAGVTRKRRTECALAFFVMCLHVCTQIVFLCGPHTVLDAEVKNLIKIPAFVAKILQKDTNPLFSLIFNVLFTLFIE